MGEHPRQPQAGELRDPSCQGRCVRRENTASPEPAVDLNPDVDRRPRGSRGTGQEGGSFGAVDRQGHRSARRQPDGAIELGGRNDLEGDQDRRLDAGGDQRFRFIEFRHGDPDRTGGKLALRDLGRLVGLEVWAKPETDPP